MGIEAYRPIDQQSTLNAAADLPPIDCEALTTRCMSDVDFALSLLAMFESTGRSYTDNILRHTTEGDSHSAAEAAHYLRGAAAIIGADALSEKALRAETAGEASDLACLKEIVDELQIEIERCLAYIPSLRIDLGRRRST